MPTYGEVLAREVKFRQPRRFPWQKPQVVEVTLTKPTKLSDGNLGNPLKEVRVIHKPFMEAVGVAQSRRPGWQLQIKTIDTTPAWLKELRENAKLAEAQMETVIEGAES